MVVQLEQQDVQSGVLPRFQNYHRKLEVGMLDLWLQRSSSSLLAVVVLLLEVVVQCTRGRIPEHRVSEFLLANGVVLVRSRPFVHPETHAEEETA